MSEWDLTRQKREKLNQKHALFCESMSYTAFIPSDYERLWRLLVFDEKNTWNKKDLLELSIFVEAFVLYDYVGLPDGLYDGIGPSIIDKYSKAEQLPIFNIKGILSDHYLKDEGISAERYASIIKNIFNGYYGGQTGSHLNY